MTEMFKLVKPHLSQLDILEIEFYAYIMDYKFIYDERKVLLNNEDRKLVGYIQNGFKTTKIGNKEIKKPVLNIIYGTEKVCLSDLMYSALLLNEFITRMEKSNIPAEKYKTKGMYIFLYELSQVDFFRRYKNKNTSEKEEGSVIIEANDYASQKCIAYNIISNAFPKAKVLFRKTDNGILIVSKDISSKELEEILSGTLNFKIKIVNDKGLYESLRYGKKFPSRRERA